MKLLQACAAYLRAPTIVVDSPCVQELPAEEQGQSQDNFFESGLTGRTQICLHKHGLEQKQAPWAKLLVGWDSRQ